MAVAGGGGAPGPDLAQGAELADIQISSEDLFRNAMEPDPAVAPEPSTDVAEGTPGSQPGTGGPPGAPPPPEQDQLHLDQDGRLRNQRGQFASPQQVADHNRRAAVSPQPQPQPQPGQGGPQDDAEAVMVPSWRLREQREGFASQFAQMQQQYDRMFQMIERMQAPRQAPQPQAPAPQLPDPVIDPIGYQRGMEEQMTQGLRAVMLENNLRMTALEVGKPVFQAAYDAFLEAGRAAPDFARSVVNSPDPGERIMSWYNNQRVLQEIGGDPHAWMARQLEAALANPQFLARALEAAQQQARGQPPANPGNGRQPPPQQRGQARHEVQLPPSLSNMRGASLDGAGDDVVDYGHGVTVSDNDLFKGAMAPAPRRGR